MLPLNRLVEMVPDTRIFVRDASAASVENPRGVWRTVQKNVEDQMTEIQQNSRLNNSKKFRVFIGKFLYVQIRSEKADRVMKYLESKYNTPNELAIADPYYLITIFRNLGYRFPDRARTLIAISKILRDRFNSNIDDYIKFVDGNYSKDPILQVKGVGYKTRDIALSSFTTEYSLVDVHISNVLSRTGLILRAYLYGFKLTTNRSDVNDYLEITRLLSKLSGEAGMLPFELDQTLWFFGQAYCTPKKCEKCPVQKCVTRDLKQPNP